MQSFAFDVERMSRAYGITSENELLTFVMRIDEGSCRVLLSQRFQWRVFSCTCCRSVTAQPSI